MGNKTVDSETFKALSNEYRFGIVMFLSINGSMFQDSISNAFFMPQSTCSYHLSILKNNGFITEKKIGSRVFYSLNKLRFDEVRRFLSCTTELNLGTSSFLSES